MNKITTKIMAVLAIAFALASCTEVDLWDEETTPHKADVTLSVSNDFTSDSTLFVAHRLFVANDIASAVAGSSTTFKDIATGDYKFYALTLDRSVYDYGGSVDSLLTIVTVSDSTGSHKEPLAESINKDDIIVSFKPYSWSKASWANVKNALTLSGDFINPDVGTLYCDSTMKVSLKPSTASSLVLENHSSLTTKFSVSLNITAQTDITNYSVYCVIPNVGKSIDLQKNVDYTTCYQALVKMKPEKNGNTYTYTGDLNAFGVTPGTMTVYVCNGNSLVQKGEASYTVTMRGAKINASGTVLTIK